MNGNLTSISEPKQNRGTTHASIAEEVRPQKQRSHMGTPSYRHTSISQVTKNLYIYIYIYIISEWMPLRGLAN